MRGWAALVWKERRGGRALSLRVVISVIICVLDGRMAKAKL